MSRLISSELDRFVTALWLERGLSDNTCQAYRRDVQGSIAGSPSSVRAMPWQPQNRIYRPT